MSLLTSAIWCGSSFPMRALNPGECQEQLLLDNNSLCAQAVCKQHVAAFDFTPLAQEKTTTKTIRWLCEAARSKKQEATKEAMLVLVARIE